MIQNYKIVTLCGSTRFKDQFLETQKRLTLEGCIVISVGLFGHSGDEEVWKPGTKEMLIIAMQQMHIGDKWEIYIPAEMGYGKFSQPGIPGGSTLIFEIELLGIE